MNRRIYAITLLCAASYMNPAWAETVDLKREAEIKRPL